MISGLEMNVQAILGIGEIDEARCAVKSVQHEFATVPENGYLDDDHHDSRF